MKNFTLHYSKSAFLDNHDAIKILQQMGIFNYRFGNHGVELVLSLPEDDALMFELKGGVKEFWKLLREQHWYWSNTISGGCNL